MVGILYYEVYRFFMLLLFFFPISDVHQIGESALIGPRVKEYLADASTPSVRGVWPAKMDPRGQNALEEGVALPLSGGGFASPPSPGFSVDHA